MIEREIKLAADVGMTMPDFSDVVANAAVGPVSALHLDAVYYDTPTLSLARAGITLRARTGEPGPVWTLKLPTPEDGDAMARHEFTFDEPLGSIPVDARLAARAHHREESRAPARQNQPQPYQPQSRGSASAGYQAWHRKDLLLYLSPRRQ